MASEDDFPYLGSDGVQRPKVCGDLLFTRNHGEKIATLRTGLDRKIDWDDNAAT